MQLSLTSMKMEIQRYFIIDDENNYCFQSIDSRKGRSTGVSSRHQTPRSERRTMNRRRGSDVTEEQIYEEPESPVSVHFQN